MAQADPVSTLVRAPIPGTHSKASTNPILSAHAAFVAAIMGHPPRPIPIDADFVDLEDRAEHLDQVLGALSAYLAVVLDDTAQNTPGCLVFSDAEALLADLTSEVTGAIQRAADELAGRPA